MRKINKGTNVSDKVRRRSKNSIFEKNKIFSKSKTTSDAVKELVLDITSHAARQMKQRGIKRCFIEYARNWGAEEYQTGGCYKYLVRRKDVQKAKRQGEDIACCSGLVVIIKTSKGKDELVTAYWDHQNDGKGRK